MIFFKNNVQFFYVSNPYTINMNRNISSIFTPEVAKQIMDIYLQSVKNDKEYSMVVCNGSVYPLRSIESTKRSTKVILNDDILEKMCGGEGDMVYLHTHANYFPRPSLGDHKANQKFFDFRRLQYSCIAGTSGVFCTNRHGEEITYPWGSGYFGAIENDAYIEIVRGDSLFCEEDEDKQYKCQIARDDFTKNLGLFDGISMDESIWGEFGSNVITQIHSPNEVLECTIMKDPDNDNATLNCFKKSVAETEYARTTSNNCQFIDVCHPKM